MHQHHITGMLCSHAASKERPILQVVHQHDGMWVFSCGEGDHTALDAYVGLCQDCSMKKMKEFQLLRGMAKGEWAKREAANEFAWSQFLLPQEEDIE